jgi:hypothetical protein
LDERFRLPNKVWDKLPQYRGYGFVVFKLRAGEATIHPMAFAFPTAQPKRNFFPTVHIHDGQVHDSASFDHSLFCQFENPMAGVGWEESAQLASQFVNVSRTQGVVLGNRHLYRKMLHGRLANEDIWLPGPPQPA